MCTKGSAGQVSANMSTDMSVDARPILGRHIGRVSTDISAAFCRVSVDSRSITLNLSTDVSADIGSVGYQSTVGGISVWCRRREINKNQCYGF